MRITLNKDQLKKTAVETLGITVGAVLMALALVLFLMPHRLAAGGGKRAGGNFVLPV